MKNKAFIPVILVSILLSFATARSEPEKFAVHKTPRPIPVVQFQNEKGETRSLADYKGKIVLLNIWATWCGPCRKEMPTLDRLQAELGGDNFQVVALSIDLAGPEVVRKFYNEIGIKHLDLLIDRESRVMRGLGVIGLPTTLLLDRNGAEIARLVGPAEWDTSEMQRFFKNIIQSSKP
ncbi:MAG: TlpA family protein disulfide reductase [Geminicoccales bacterium]